MASPVERPRNRKGRPSKFPKMRNGKFSRKDFFLYVPSSTIPSSQIRRFLELCDQTVISTHVNDLHSIDIQNISYYCRDSIIADKLREEFAKLEEGMDSELLVEVCSNVENLEKRKDKYFNLFKSKISKEGISEFNQDGNYKEKIYEDFTRDNPFEVLGEHLHFVSQQEEHEGLFPDLIFRDVSNNLVIVELQLGPLDYKHLYKTALYRDLAELKRPGSSEARAIIICNGVKEALQLPAKKLNIEIRIITEKAFLDMKANKETLKLVK